jgi:Inner membrane protein YgaP-like, transmembrane domain
MTVERGVRMLAGTFVLASLALGAPSSPLFVDARWLWLAVFVGANLLQSSVTGFCPAELVLRWVGLRPAAPPAR